MKKNYSQLFFFVFLFLANLTLSAQKTLPRMIQTEGKNISVNEIIDVLKKDFKIQEEIGFKQKKKITDKLGFEHIKLQENYKGVPVQFGQLIVHAKAGKVKAVNGDYYDVEGINVKPSLSPKAALQNALNQIGAQEYMWQKPGEAKFMNYSFPKGELVILPDFQHKRSKAQKAPRLAYKFDIYATKPVSRAYVYVDAHNGKILYKDAIIKHAVANGGADTRYSGHKTIKTDSYNGNYRLRDYSRGSGIETFDMNQGKDYSSAVDFVDNDNNWSSAEYDNAAKDNAALDAHYGAQMTYDYWKIKHNRNSYDGNGTKIKSYVHYDKNYDNAYWNGSVMTYGDGSGTVFDALTSLDVAGHEIGHAVCSSTADLTYSNESGALNEALSDIWGASIEYFAEPNKQTWLIGEDIERRSGHAALRSMSDPKSEGQPDTYKGTNWYTGSSQSALVHTNSGVANYWYYLISVGGNGTNDNGDAYNVSGIGIDKAGNIVYRAESVYLTSSTTYAEMRDYTIQAAKDLYGAGSAEEQTVTNAWYAVGVGAPYGVLSYCASKGNSVSDEYIQRVQLNTIDKSSDGGNGYSNFTSISTDLTLGQTYTITVTPKWTGTAYNEAYAVWIDYNHDGDFADAGELVWSKAASKDTPNSGTFTVPNSASQTATRMRVSMKYNGIPTACETFDYGEVEDYTVNLVAGSADTQAPSAPSNLTATNITQTSVDLSWTASTDNVGVTEYDIYKNGTYVGKVTGTSAQVTGLKAATNYSFYVKAKDAAGNVSGASNTVNVTTQSDSTGGNCSSTVSNYPYYEGFENTLGAWTQSTADDFDWTVKTGATPSTGTGPSAAAEGSYYVYMESSSPNYSNKKAILESPCFDLNGVSNPQVSFKYHMYGDATKMGYLKLEVSTDNGVNWNAVWTKSGNQGNAWNTATVDLSSYTGQVLKMRFFGETGTTWKGDMAIDAFKVGNNTCVATTLSITFDNYPEETSWEIKDNGGNVVYSGGTYGSEPDGSTKVINLCIAPGCYTFVMKDSYGDGMCCSYGNGSYSFTKDSDGTVLASGGSYTSNESTDFCLNTNGFASSENGVHENMIDLDIYPNPVDNFMMLKIKDQNMNKFSIMNMTGQKVLSGDINEDTINVSKLKPGVYFIKIMSDKKNITQRFIKK